jgi:hypothetical protein
MIATSAELLQKLGFNRSALSALSFCATVTNNDFVIRAAIISRPSAFCKIYFWRNPMSDGWNIALLGATGAVGEALLELLQEASVPGWRTLSRWPANAVPATVRFNGKRFCVQKASEFDWSQVQLAFFVAGSEASALLCGRSRQSWAAW